MIRRLNYTDRKRIRREDIDISVTTPVDGVPEFEISLNLLDYKLPSEGIVFMEAYRRTTLMRFPLGTVTEVVVPADRKLGEFDTPEGVLFRVRVSSTSPDRGKLLAEADRISFRKPDSTTEERVPLLPVQSADLGAEVTKLDFDDRPTLLINSATGNWRDVARSPVFASLTYPNAFREILIRILRIEKFFDTDEAGDWKCQWLTYAAGLPGVGELPDEGASDSDLEVWIDDAVRVFSQRCQMYERFKTYWEGEQAQ